jgi:hypothetical protein
VAEITEKVSASVAARVLPLLGFSTAIIVNAAWVGFSGDWVVRLI